MNIEQIKQQLSEVQTQIAVQNNTLDTLKQQALPLKQEIEKKLNIQIDSSTDLTQEVSKLNKQIEELDKQLEQLDKQLKQLKQLDTQLQQLDNKA